MKTPLIVTTSWDDGHPSDLRVADLLEKHGLSGTFYVPCVNVEGKPVMGAADIVRLGQRFEIGGHTRDHVSLTATAPQLAEDQIRYNKHWLEDLLGKEVPGFAYVRGHHDQRLRKLVKEAGFQYARTVRNLMSTPGSDPLQVPTTVQFYRHSRATYLRNYISGGPAPSRAAVLASLLLGGGLEERCSEAIDACARLGGYFHLWGHSWELDEHDLWQPLEELFIRLRASDAHFVTNSGWCASVTGRVRTRRGLPGEVVEASPGGP